MASNEQNLSPDQSEKILYFQEISGLENLQACREILQHNNWDMEMAVQQQFADAFPESSQPLVSSSTPVRDLPIPPVNLHPIDQRVYDNRRPESIFSWAGFLALLPFRFVYTTIYDIYKLLSIRSSNDHQSEVQSFISHFDATYGINHPRFLNYSYSQALNEAKRELKFLLVYLHGDDHEDTNDFCLKTLCDPDFVTFADHNILMWACNQRSKQGHQVSLALNETTYPFMALIVLRNGRMTVIAKICGSMRPSTLTTNLLQAISDNQASLVAARAVKDEQSMTQNIRREQDEAFELSLQQDRQKAKKKQEERLRIENKEKEIQEQQDSEERKIKELVLKKEQIRDQLPQEPDSDHPDKIDVLLKLPNGTRLERRFLITDSLEVLHNYVFVHELAPDNFQIVSNFPRKVLPIKSCELNKTPPTFKEFGMGKKEMLFVQNTD